MKNLKRLAVLAAAGCMVFALSACSGSGDSTAGNAAPAEDTEETNEEAAEAEEAEAAEEAELAEAEPEETVPEYTPGTLTETSYENASLNLKYTLPEGYVMATAEELGNVMDAGTEALNEEGQELAELGADSSTNEMMAAGEAGATNLTVATQSLGIAGLITEEQYLDMIREGLQEYTAEGIEYEVTEDVQMRTIAGAEYKGLHVSADYSGVSVVQDIWVREIGGRMVLITLSYTDDMAESAEELLAGFEAVE